MLLESKVRNKLKKDVVNMQNVQKIAKEILAGKYDKQKKIIEKFIKPIKIVKIEGNKDTLFVSLSGNTWPDKKVIKSLTKELNMETWAPGQHNGKPTLTFYYQ
jgi:hypothetical protein